MPNPPKRLLLINDPTHTSLDKFLSYAWVVRGVLRNPSKEALVVPWGISRTATSDAYTALNSYVQNVDTALRGLGASGCSIDRKVDLGSALSTAGAIFIGSGDYECLVTELSDRTSINISLQRTRGKSGVNRHMCFSDAIRHFVLNQGLPYIGSADGAKLAGTHPDAELLRLLGVQLELDYDPDSPRAGLLKRAKTASKPILALSHGAVILVEGSTGTVLQGVASVFSKDRVAYHPVGSGLEVRL